MGNWPGESRTLTEGLIPNPLNINPCGRPCIPHDPVPYTAHTQPTNSPKQIKAAVNNIVNIDTPAFDQLALGKPVIKALQDVGYEKPSPIQAQTIPVLLKGQDVLGQAQTGTGKTAAFALPTLTQIDLKNRAPQVLVLAPTRELAIQVAEAFKTYASHMKGFHVLPVYGLSLIHI